MSDDIVERLRRRMAWWKDDCEDLRESADEITRLRSDLAAVTDERDAIKNELQENINKLDVVFLELNIVDAQMNDAWNKYYCLKKDYDDFLENEQKINKQQILNLLDALKPFAAAYNFYWTSTPDEYLISDDEMLVMSDLRRAKEVYENTK